MVRRTRDVPDSDGLVSGMGLTWPLGAGRDITSKFGPRTGGFHAGVDFGRVGGSAGMPVYAVESGTVQYCGAAQGYGGPDPAGWIVIDSASGAWEYGHIVREPWIAPGAKVVGGQRIAVINPNRETNAFTAPHLHLSYMPGGYDPNRKVDPLPYLSNAREPGTMTAPKPDRPDFNEYPMWSPNNQKRNGTKVDLFLLHTQEGNANADGLARWLGNRANQVSYHYTVSQDYKDQGVTVVDVVDTDLASWSVLSANNRSINLVFAGSRASWSRDQWMKQSRAIDVAAYLAVQDCRKYGIPLTVIAPPYTAGRAGISDHAYVTKVLRDGTHTDVGPGFPWDYFAGRVAHWANPAPKPPDLTDRQLLEQIDAKLDKLLAK